MQKQGITQTELNQLLDKAMDKCGYSAKQKKTLWRNICAYFEGKISFEDVFLV